MRRTFMVESQSLRHARGRLDHCMDRAPLHREVAPRGSACLSCPCPDSLASRPCEVALSVLRRHNAEIPRMVSPTDEQPATLAALPALTSGKLFFSFGGRISRRTYVWRGQLVLLLV